MKQLTRSKINNLPYCKLVDFIIFKESAYSLIIFLEKFYVKKKFKEILLK